MVLLFLLLPSLCCPLSLFGWDYSTPPYLGPTTAIPKEPKNINVLHDYLESRDVIIIGYGGWNDGLMAALRRCDSSKHRVYWCDVRSRPTSHIARFLRERAGGATYVRLGEGGAGDLMRAIYETLIPAEFHQDPIQRHQDWLGLVRNRKGRE